MPANSMSTAASPPQRIVQSIRAPSSNGRSNSMSTALCNSYRFQRQFKNNCLHSPAFFLSVKDSRWKIRFNFFTSFTWLGWKKINTSMFLARRDTWGRVFTAGFLLVPPFNLAFPCSFLSIFSLLVRIWYSLYAVGKNILWLCCFVTIRFNYSLCGFLHSSIHSDSYLIHYDVVHSLFSSLRPRCWSSDHLFIHTIDQTDQIPLCNVWNASTGLGK